MRARQSGDLGDELLTPDLFRAWLIQRIEQLDVESANNDVRRFIANAQVLDIWSHDYFMQLAGRIRFTNTGSVMLSCAAVRPDSSLRGA